MSSELDVMALASEGANVLITEMTRGGWNLIRDALANFFRRDGRVTATRQLEMLDEVEQGLAGASQEDREQIEQRLVRLLAAYLDRFPEMAEELQDFVRSEERAPAGPAPTMSAHHNTDSQIVQALGNIDAGRGGINYRAPRGGGR